MYRSRNIVGAVRRARVMVDCRHHTVVTDKRIVADINASVVLEFASGIDKNIFAEMDILSKIRLKRSHHSYRRMNLAASEFTEKCVSPVSYTHLP